MATTAGATAAGSHFAADRWLYGALTDAPGRRLPFATVAAEAKALGFGERLVRMAGKRLGVRKLPGSVLGLYPTASVYFLPANAAPPPEPSARREAEPEAAPPASTGVLTRKAVQRVYDAVWREMGGCGAWRRGMPGTPRLWAATKARQVQAALAEQLTAAGIPLPVVERPHVQAAPLWNLARVIVRGDRPVVSEFHYPMGAVLRPTG